MSDTTVVAVTAVASAGVPWAVLAACAVSVAVLAYAAGWLAHYADRRWPAGTTYQKEGEQ